MDGKSVMRAGAWAVGALVAFVVIAYVGLLVVNWNDEPPSADSRRLAAILRDRAPVDDARNGYVHALGLAAPRGADPLVLGSQRRAWLEQVAASPGNGVDNDLPGEDVDYRAARSDDVSALASACTAAAACLEALRADPGAAEQWLASEQWLLQRYRRMLATSGWKEAVPGDINAPLAGYQHVMDLQKLYLLDVHRQAMAHDAVMVRDALEHDLAFWRNVLASSDLLISKMMAVEAVKRNLALGNMAMRQLPPGLVDAAVPASWRRPVTDAERSLVRPIAGEWHLVSRMLSAAMRSGGFVAGDDGGQRVADRLFSPLMQPQATLNLGAARMAGWGDTSQRPYADIGRALERQAVVADRGPRLQGPYNPVGALLASAWASGSYNDYIARASDLEGIRRAALLAATLRGSGIGRADAADAVRQAPLRNPYDGAAFDWDTSAGAVVVRGLAAGERSRYAFPL